MSLIVLENVVKAYGSHRALDGVDVAFKDGVTTAIVGRSGSGKSSLLQSINGLLRPDSGHVLVNGSAIDYEALATLRRGIGYAVQGTGLFPHMTVAENVGLLARLEGWASDRIDHRVESLMSLVSLPLNYRPRYPHELSGGEQQRVGLCRTMILDPPILLLDEPFGALDPITRAEIHGEFEALQNEAARTIILVTHDLVEARRLASRLVVLADGRVSQHDTVENVLASPADDDVADLLATQLGQTR